MGLLRQSLGLEKLARSFRLEFPGHSSHHSSHHSSTFSWHLTFCSHFVVISHLCLPRSPHCIFVRLSNSGQRDNGSNWLNHNTSPRPPFTPNTSNAPNAQYLPSAQPRLFFA